MDLATRRRSNDILFVVNVSLIRLYVGKINSSFLTANSYLFLIFAKFTF